MRTPETCPWEALPSPTATGRPEVHPFFQHLSQHPHWSPYLRASATFLELVSLDTAPEVPPDKLG